MSLFSLAFDTGVRRTPSGWTGLIAKTCAAATAVWTVHAAAFSQTDVLPLTIIFLSAMMALTFLLIGSSPNSDRETIPWYDWLLALAATLIGAYFVYHADDIAQRITLLDDLSAADMTAATLVIVLTLEAVRRTVGLGLTIIVVGFMAYNLFGDRLSGPLAHGEISASHFLDIMIFTTDGLFGVPLRVAATYAFLFVLFGTTLAKTGGAEFFFDLAAAIAGRSKGGPAKIAVISSGLYGTISGSPTSDVVTTGSVTIPIMKRIGYSPAFAGGVEVAASTGGSLVPPVMGAAAFIMAEYTGIAYVDIALAALIPALLYYLPIYLQVDLRAHRANLAGIGEEQIRPLARVLSDGGLFLLPPVAITWALLDGYTPTYSALYGTVAVIGVAMLRKRTRISPIMAFEILHETSTKMVAVAGACAAAGLVIGGITMTGLASKFSHLVFLLSDKNVILSLMLAAALTILLGLGMPTPSAYILAAVLVSPVLSSLSIDLMAGHLFLLYFAVMSALTPPVAVAAYAASAIADENPLRIALVAVRIAIAAFLVPFAFVFDPALLLKGSPLEVVLATLLVATGLSLIVVAIEGFLRQPIHSGLRLACGAVGFALLFARPMLQSQLA
ncbi:MAG: TRAP transporter permease [Hyphomicrobiaceae bacterium]